MDKLSDAIARHDKEYLRQKDARPAILVAHEVPLTRELIAHVVRTILLREEPEPRNYSDIKVDYLTVPTNIREDGDALFWFIANNRQRIALALFHEEDHGGFQYTDDILGNLSQATARVSLNGAGKTFEKRGPNSKHELGGTLDSQFDGGIFNDAHLRTQVDEMDPAELGDHWKHSDYFTLNDETIGDTRLASESELEELAASDLHADYDPKDIDAAREANQSSQARLRGMYHQVFHRTANRIADQHGDKIKTAILDALKIRPGLIPPGFYDEPRQSSTRLSRSRQ
ncbi:MAG: hypothetical protein WCT53_05550 [Candidatus Gracilibacteria bacterium]